MFIPPCDSSLSAPTIIIPLGHIGNDRSGKLDRFFVSDAASYVAGTAVKADGGKGEAFNLSIIMLKKANE